MRKTVVLFLCVVLITSFVFAGCTVKTDNNVSISPTTTATSGTTASAGQEDSQAGVFPIVKEKVTLSIMAPDDSKITDIEKNDFTLWYENYTNVHIDWRLTPPDGFKQQVSVVLASGSLPDIIQDANFSNTQLILYGSQGLFTSLNDSIDKFGVAFTKTFEGYPELPKLLTAPDGNIYALPKITDVYHTKYYQGRAWIYQPWLDTLGLDMPKTTEDLYNVLKAFKEKDPNGNNKQDEIPFTGLWDTTVGAGERGPDMNIDRFIMNSFIYTGSNYFIMNNGKVEVAYNQEGWKEGLKFLNKLYNDGLLDPASFTQKQPQIATLGENADPVLGFVPAGHPGRFTKVAGERFGQYVAVPPLVGPNGVNYAFYRPYNYFVGGTFVITKDCKIPEVAYRWADGFYDLDVNMRKSYGEEGKHWTKDVGDLKGLDGRPAMWVGIEELYGQLQDVCWQTFGLTYAPKDMRLGQGVKDPGAIEALLYNETKNKYEGHEPDAVLPLLYFEETQANELARLDSALYSYVFESFAQFITGNKNIDTEWDKYITELNNIGLKSYLEIYQQAYDLSYSK